MILGTTEERAFLQRWSILVKRKRMLRELWNNADDYTPTIDFLLQETIKELDQLKREYSRFIYLNSEEPIILTFGDE